MKKWFVIILALVCALALLAGCGKKDEEKPAEKPEETTVPAKEAEYDDRLDAAFAAGKLTVQQADPQLPDPETCEVVLPSDDVLAAYGFEKASAEQTVRGALKQKSVKLLSYSPDGSVAVGYIPAGEAAVLAAITKDRVTILYPADQRGQGDLKQFIEADYLKLYSIRQPDTINWMDKYGLIWSPDGRYFCPLSRQVMFTKSSAVGAQSNVTNKSTATAADILTTQAQGDQVAEKKLARAFDAYYVVDTQTGEMFALDGITGPSSLWLDAAFSEDGQFLDVFYRGNRFSAEDMTEIKMIRYDLATGEEQVSDTGLKALPDIPEYITLSTLPCMTRLKDGRYFAASSRSAMNSQRLVRFGGNMPAEQEDLAWMAEQAGGRIQYAWGSEKTGEILAFVYMENRTGMAIGLNCGLMHINANGDLSEGTDGLWVVPVKTMRPERMTFDEITARWAAFPDAKKPADVPDEERFLVIRCLQISPGGRYALALAEGTELVPLLIRLSDMACVPVEGAELDKLCSAADFSALVRFESNVFSWSEAGILITAGDGALYQVR